jgi:hypothetical protein
VLYRILTSRGPGLLGCESALKLALLDDCDALDDLRLLAGGSKLRWFFREAARLLALLTMLLSLD